MRTEADIRARIQQTQGELVQARKLWRAAVNREFAGALSNARGADDDPQLLSAATTVYEAELEALHWVLGRGDAPDTPADTSNTPSAPV